MKSNIHPKYHSNSKVTCSCGESFETGSTMEKMEVDICSACHPFFTGENKLVDTLGRVDKFEQARKKAEALQKAKLKKASENNEDSEDQEDSPKTIKEMMEDVAKQTTGTSKK